MAESGQLPANASSSHWKATFFASIAGIATGIFFGEYCEVLEPLAQAYVGLLQMTVLPLVVAMLIASLGRLNPAKAKHLSICVGITTLGLWSVGATTLLLANGALPPWEGGTFYSPNLVDPAGGPDFFKLYIPSNPFESLASTSIPAVVMFCVFFGVSLMTTKGKSTIINLLDNVVDTLTQVNRMILRINPLGVFVLSAQAAGTIQTEMLEKLEIYFIVVVGMYLLLIFWVLPQLVSIFTPFSYGEVLAVSRTFLITVAAVGKLIVVLPLVLDASRTLFERHRVRESEVDSTLETVIPVTYPFPGLEDFVVLFFVPFAGWYVGHMFSLAEFPAFLTLGLASSFASPTITIPFLLSEYRIPLDLFRLYLVSGVYLRYGVSMLASMDVFVTGLIATAAIHRFLRFSWRKAVQFVVLTAVMVAVGVGATRWYVSSSVALSSGIVSIMDMKSINTKVDIKIFEKSSPNSVPLKDSQSRLDRILETGVLRVGCNDGSMPFTYVNKFGELTGLDVDVVSTLAKDLGVRIELYPIEKGKMAESLRKDHFDVAVSDITGSLYRSERMVLTHPYLQVHVALVVPDHRAAEFRDFHEIQAMKSLRVGAVHGSIYAERAKRFFPHADVVLYDCDEDFFHGKRMADVLLTSAEGGAGWTLKHAQYEVVDPFRANYKVPLVYALGHVEGESFGKVLQWRAFLDNWLQVRMADGTIDDLYEHWVCGTLPTASHKRRWSVIHDVLGWDGALAPPRREAPLGR